MEIVLFEASPRTQLAPAFDTGAELWPVWHEWVDTTKIRSVVPEVANAPDGGALVALDECVNGTGGCTQRFLLRRGGSARTTTKWHGGGAWRELRPVFRDSLARRFPDARRSGFHVDPRTLRVMVMPRGEDAPRTVARLRIRDDALELPDARPCSTRDSTALLPTTDPAYGDATTVATTLRGHGIAVFCVLSSKLATEFEGTEGGAHYRTDRGGFDAVFLARPRDFARLRVVMRREGDSYVYSFRGAPRPAGTNRMESAGGPLYFLIRGNALFVVSDAGVASALESRLGARTMAHAK